MTALPASSDGSSKDFLYSQVPLGKYAVAACPEADRSAPIRASWGNVTGTGSGAPPLIISAKEFTFAPTVQWSLKEVRRMDGILCHQGCYRYHEIPRLRRRGPLSPGREPGQPPGSRCYVDPRPGPVAPNPVVAQRGGGNTWRRTCSSTVAATGVGVTSGWPACCAPTGTRSTLRP